MSNVEVLSQVIVTVAYIVCGIAFLQKEQYRILCFILIFNSLMLFQYYLLNATMGMIANTINIIRNLIFMYNLKHNRENHICLLMCFFVITILLTICFYTSCLDVFPCFIALLSTFSYWVNNTKKLRICNILCSMCYIIYAIPIHSYVTIVAETFLIVTTIIGYIRYEHKKT